MNDPIIQLTNTIPSIKNSTSRSPLRRGFLLIALPLALVCFALSPLARAVSPAPDGGYANDNTAEGDGALSSLTTGEVNTAIGFDALFSNTTGRANTATGGLALEHNTTGNDNTANGVSALQNNTTGGSNTANGTEALLNNTTGSFNTANGLAALISNTTGTSNTATGVDALYGNTTGNFNTASGEGALLSNTTGHNNTADGQNALKSNTTGSNNIALGSNAGTNLTTGSNNIDLFNRGMAGEANTIRIGKQATQTATFIAGISGATVTGTTVVVNGSGQLGVAPSSQRFKQNIQAMGAASDALLALRPVTFHYKPELDPKGIPQFGLIAEQVEKVDPNLVARDDQGKAYTVRYDAVNAMLLNEFLKEHRKVEEQGATIAELRSTIARQDKTTAALAEQVREQNAKIEKITVQIATNRAAPQLAQK